MGSALKGLLGIVAAGFVFSAAASEAEMTVTTRDGRTLTLPVEAGDVKRIDFSSGSGGIEFLGCFKDQGDPTGTGGRDLDGLARNDAGMTTQLCASTCRSKGFEYAGTQYSTWCFCGSTYGKSGPADNCDMACGGDKQAKCGGAWANSVYRVR